ncbi:3-isopropylmalate dehydratase large subunit [Intestinimonas butyriciproducens]|uniref:3-isopropylmalate dehydratase large subunit n=1 Tax=Intestinimonas butyriciproducens TaxID=1297617 RepID=UPI00242FAC21|nr:aconitase/3-isopropylmalate dehydratase large subunit family protein [Intestinimonas butyriciproducens]
MGRTMTRKILEQKIGRCIETGQVYFFPVDCAMTHDVGTAGVAPLLEQYGTQALSPRVEMVVILDHFVPATTLSQAQSHKDARAFVRRWGVEHFYEIGRGGICHQVLLEKGHARSGDLLVATDAHVTTYGGVGCLGLGVGVTDVAMTLHTGLMWLKVPQAVGVRLEGALSHAAAKDLALYLLHLIPFSQLNYRVVEFYGPGVEGLTMDDRFCLCNMLSEGGVKSCLVAGDERTAAYMQARAAGPWTLVEPDLDADYAFRYELCLDDVRPMVAFPHHPTLGRDAAEAGGIPIDQAFLGSCTNGRIEDLRVGASIVRGKQVHPRVRFVVTPASQEVYLQAIREGLIQDFVRAGAMVTNPSCGACIGASSLLAPGEVCVSTSNRNFQGRMGSVDALIYLASPATVARSALAGSITTGEEQ